jgi:hypothetical protein
MSQGGKFRHEGRNKEISMSMINVLAVAFKSGIYLFLAEVKRISPIDISILHKGDVWVSTIVPI